MADHAAALYPWCTISILLCLISASQASKVLIGTTPVGKSHMMNLKKIAKEVEQRGHRVMWATMASDVPFLQPTNSSITSYAMHGMSYDTPIPEWRITANTPWDELWKGYNPLAAASCMGLMSNQTALDLLKAFQADVMIAEMLTPCSALLAHTLDLPWINHWPLAPLEPYFTTLWPGSNRRLFQPNPLSYYPQFRSTGAGPTTQHLSLWQRVENFVMYWLWAWDDWRINSAAVRDLYKHYDFDPDLPEERRRLVLTIAPVDWAAEWLRPVTPNFKLVGPVLAGPGKPLPAHLEAFMNGAGKEGVLLVSLGTVAELNEQQLRGMAAAFAALPCKVLWRLTLKEVPDEAAIAALGLGNNTQVLTWAPQNDILAHPNLRAFLSHVGINSMYEAIYHGKPIVGMPFFGDQPSNADKVVATGIGVRLDPSQAGTPAFGEAIMEVLSNERYTSAAQGMSVKIRARKNTPVQEAADWIEHVLATGGEPYQKTPEDELSFIVRNSLDVYAIVAACCCILTIAAKGVLQLLLSTLMPTLKAWRADGSLPWAPITSKAKVS